MGTFSRNADRATTVSDAVSEAIDATSLVSARKTHSVVLSVNGNVLLVAAFELLDSSLDVLHTPWLSHLLTREVAVQPSPVPVTWDWLGVERDLGAELLSNSGEKETSEPELITHCIRLVEDRQANWCTTHAQYPHTGRPGTPIGLA